MPTYFILALLGHLVGDYLLQTKYQALTKANKNMAGILACTLHVCIYSLIVMVFLNEFDLIIFLAIAIPHWLIDRYSLATYWLKLIKGRTFDSALVNSSHYQMFDIAFTCIVYTVVDNTFHILSLLLVIKFYILANS